MRGAFFWLRRRLLHKMPLALSQAALWLQKSYSRALQQIFTKNFIKLKYHSHSVIPVIRLYDSLKDLST